MSNEKYGNRIIIYGFGKEAKEACKEFYFPSEVVEMIIDRDANLYASEFLLPEVKRVTLEEFRDNCMYKSTESKTIVIGSEKCKIELRDNIRKISELDTWNIIVMKQWLFENNFLTMQKKMEELMKDAGPIRPELMENAKALSKREDVLLLLPEGLTVAEVGVAYGYFTEKIIQQCHPKHFYAIDVFDDKTVDLCGMETLRLNKMSQYEYYVKRFENYISEDILKIRRGLSSEKLKEFPDNYFDYLYLDASHDYRDVIKDVKEAVRVVKNGGVIQFNDYIYFDYNSKIYYGVMPAVNKFVNTTNSKVIYYCLSRNGFDDIVVQVNK